MSGRNISLTRTALLQSAPPAALVAHSDIHLRGALPAIPHTPKAAEHRLTLLEVDGLTYHMYKQFRFAITISLSAPYIMARGA